MWQTLRHHHQGHLIHQQNLSNQEQMGANLCSFRQSSPEPLSKHDASSNQQVGPRMSITELKPGFLKTQKKKKKRQLHIQEKKITKVGKLTLEEWLLTSPGLKKDCINGGELHVLKEFSNRIYPASTRVHEHFSSKPRESFSERDLEVSSISRSQSGKLKKVRFRLPAEADIIVFSSPEQEFGELID